MPPEARSGFGCESRTLLTHPRNGWLSQNRRRGWTRAKELDGQALNAKVTGQAGERKGDDA